MDANDPVTPAPSASSTDGATRCPSCGAAVQKGALAGFCPACLLARGLETQGSEHGNSGPGFQPPAVEEVARLFPQWEVTELIGAGGMGAVYKATQASLGRIVALKLVPDTGGGNPGFADRFNREARALARLNHPNIVAVHEFGRVPAYFYFVMEFVDGANLRQLKRLGRISPREALRIVPQICDALQYAHDEGVVHRDIKPENVMLDRKGRVKIADFGLAKILDQGTETARITLEGQIIGTPHYMAPEQVEHPLTVDHRADIYSLGVVFYELLTGELPLGKFPPPSRKVQVDVRLDDIVLRALENDPERRYQHASEVRDRVSSVVDAPVPPTQDEGQSKLQQERPEAPLPVTANVEQAGGRRRVGVSVSVLIAALLCGLAAYFIVDRSSARELGNLALGYLAAVLTAAWIVRRSLKKSAKAAATAAAALVPVAGWRRLWHAARNDLLVVVLVTMLVGSCALLPALLRTRTEPARAADTHRATDSQTENSGKAPKTAPTVAVQAPAQVEYRVEADGSGAFKTIQEAIDAAPEGATIRLGAGTFKEAINIEKNVALIGKGWTETSIAPELEWKDPSEEERKAVETAVRQTTDENARRKLARESHFRFYRPVLALVKARNVRMSGIKFGLAGAPADGRLTQSAVIMIDDGAALIRGCAVVGSPGCGIGLANGAALLIEDSLVAAAWNTGIRGAQGATIEAVDTEVRNCYYAGITVGGTGRVEITRCRISGSAWHGIRYDNASPVISDSLIAFNARCGIYASGNTSARIIGNVFHSNEMSGVSCWYNCRDEISANTFAANLREGLGILGASEPKVISNIFTAQPVAMLQSAIADGRASSPPKFGTPILNGNLYWKNATDLSGFGKDLADAESGRLSVDPSFTNPAQLNFTPAPDSAARKAGLGASSKVPTLSRFPVQPEEAAMVPEGTTRDSKQWKRPSPPKQGRP